MRDCERCGKKIYFKQNKAGKWVAYTYSTDKPHVYSCSRNTDLQKQYVRQTIDLSTGLRRNLSK